MKSYPNRDIYERDNFTCQYCGWSGANDFESWNRGWLTIDHIKPRKHGGTDEHDNLVVACHTCNSVKGASMCNSIDDAKQVISTKNEQRRQWFIKYVENRE
ncbi:HNH endonuclease [Vibrio parahaemolyticus]|uniref:HNH endonuclease n=1 Tax=Vibrio vulnificus TaxID=672 RepID=UPI00193EF19A|nr:HNH endonuclease [Vibrio vulnificus]MBM4900843.1 HNH endonuclease [Vibrio parahaemolyticus]MCG9655574.1 HNH endonuclease [Vibrio vulnificus]